MLKLQIWPSFHRLWTQRKSKKEREIKYCTVLWTFFISYIQQTNSGTSFQLVSAAQPRGIEAMLSVVFASLCWGGPPLFIVTLFPCGRSVWAEHKPQRSVYMLNITVAWACGLQHGRKEPAHTDVTASNEPWQCCPCAVNRHRQESQWQM